MNFALRQWKDADRYIQSIVYATDSPSAAGNAATQLAVSLNQQFNVNFSDAAEIGDGAVIGWSDPDANNIVVSALFSQSGTMSGGLVWIHQDDDEDNTRVANMAKTMAEKARLPELSAQLA